MKQDSKLRVDLKYACVQSFSLCAVAEISKYNNLQKNPHINAIKILISIFPFRKSIVSKTI